MPDITLDSIQGEVEKARKTLGDLKTILDQLDKARSVICTVVNVTDLSLILSDSGHDHGGFATTPPAVINPRSAGAFGSQSASGSILTGTEGWVRYTAGGVSVKCHWDNPWAGGNSSDATLESGDANVYFTWSVAGNGDTKADMQFVLFQRPFQNDWRNCQKCQVMFYDGYPTNKGVCAGVPLHSPIPSAPHHGSHQVGGTANFSLPHDAPGSGQPDWRFCTKCNCLFFDGYPTKGACIAGGGHNAMGFNFVLPHDVPGPGQPEWRFCNKCYSMFYNGFRVKGVCPAGGGHAWQGYDFVLNYH